MANDPSHIYAQQMCEDEIMTYKYADGEYVFNPDGEVSRIDFLVMLMCAGDMDGSVTAVADTAAADDGGLSSGLKGFLAAASAKGIVKLDSGVFRPKSAITCEEAADMAASTLAIPALSATDKGSESAVSKLMKLGIFD